MNCVKCGCELEEGYSRFCPECGTPVENNEPTPVKNPVVINKKSENTKLSMSFRIVLGILTALSIIWVFFPLLRAPGKEITTLSAFNLVVGTNNFDGMKLSGMPALAIVFLMPQIFCLCFIFAKKINIHKLYAIIGIAELYVSVVSLCIWALVINICNSYLQGQYAYGLGFVINVIASLFIGFLCISISASQKTGAKRSQCWLSVSAVFNIVLLSILAIVHIAAFLLIGMFREIWPCTILIILSATSGIWAYFNIAKKDFSQWMVMLVHTVITLITHISLFFYANALVNDFAGNNDFLDIVELGSAYVNTIVIGIAIFALVYNTAITIWTYKTLKRPSIKR